MTTNLGSIDRTIRIVLGLILVGMPFLSGIELFQTTWGMAISVLVGIVLIATSAMRFCPAYYILGLRTCKV